MCGTATRRPNGGKFLLRRRFREKPEEGLGPYHDAAAESVRRVERLLRLVLLVMRSSFVDTNLGEIFFVVPILETSHPSPIS